MDENKENTTEKDVNNSQDVNVKNEKDKSKKIKLSTIIIIIVILAIVVGIIVYAYSTNDNCTENTHVNNNNFTFRNYPPTIDKPIIYIYPEQETEVSVKLGYEDKITCIYPSYNNGWTVTAQPDGTLIDTKTDKKYYSLYYESDNTKKYNGNLTEGFVVSKENIANFLEEKLAILGLNYKEAEEFIIYWLPKLEQKDYVYIRFQTMNEIEENMPLLVSPSPDTLIRIMMEWKSLDNSIDVKEQVLTPVTRNGYTVVEWGGTKLK